MSKLTLGILLSGRGSNFSAIAENIRQQKLNAEITCVVSNVAAAQGLEHARSLGLPAYSLESKGKEREAFDREVIQKLRQHNVEYICLAGYMRLLSSHFIQAYPNRILNIHPALLPSFPGLNAQSQALEYGVRFTGCTVHFVDEGLDTGPIILQAAVPVLSDDTLEALSRRILKEEHRIYSEALQLIAEGRVRVEGRKVRIFP
jgi:phosphoribosylglycinamide formyltransferase-1